MSKTLISALLSSGVLESGVAPPPVLRNTLSNSYYELSGIDLFFWASIAANSNCLNLLNYSSSFCNCSSGLSSLFYLQDLKMEWIRYTMSITTIKDPITMRVMICPPLVEADTFSYPFEYTKQLALFAINGSVQSIVNSTWSSMSSNTNLSRPYECFYSLIINIYKLYKNYNRSD